MVAIRKGSLIDGTSMKVVVPNYYKDCESTWGLPMYAVHREDLHAQLRLLATQEEGGGRPCEVRVRSKVVDYDAFHGNVTTESGEVLQADLVIAADGVHSAAVKHVLGDDEVVEAGDTGWACMRWLVPREDFLSDPDTAGMIQDSSTRYFTAAGGAAGLVWYPCRKYVQCCPLFPPSCSLFANCVAYSATRCRISSIFRGSLTPPTSERTFEPWWSQACRWNMARSISPQLCRLRSSGFRP